MVLFVLSLLVGLVPGVAVWACARSPRAEGDEKDARTEPPTPPLPEIAVLRDGAVGATRWAFAALVVKLARDGHCTLVRTRRRRWLRSGPVVVADLHADPTALSPLEQTVLRQLGRHDTLNGFGFAGSTFRRRTLRDVRADLVERGWLADRREASNALLALALLLVGVGGGAALLGGGGALVTALLVGGGLGCTMGAIPRYPVTEAGAQHRAAHRAHAERRRDCIQAHLPDDPARAAAVLREALPALVLDRIATPRWLTAVADRLESTAGDGPPPDWIRDDIDGVASRADACRILARVLQALGARSPIAERLSGPSRAP